MNTKGKTFKRFASVTCAIALTAASFAGCASPKKGDNKPTSSKGAEGTSSISSNPNFNATGLPIVKEKETYKIAVRQTSPIKAAADRDCVKETEEATNVHIEWVEIPGSGWTEKLNIMFSTDALPDAIVGGPDNISRTYEQLVVLDDLLDKYAPNVTEFFDRRTDYRPGLKAPDGKIHCLPTGDEARQNLIDSHIWINTEWLTNVGLTMPTTTDEFKTALKAFKEKDPNKNGKKDEIPFSFEKAWGWGNMIENMFGAFGVLENGDHAYMKDDKVVFGAQEQGYFEALKWFNELYKDGLIDKEVFTVSTDQYLTKGAGKDIMGAMAAYNINTLSVDNGGKEGGRYKPLPPLKGPKGDKMVNVANVTRTTGFAITNKCKSPEVLVRWYDYINSSLEQTLKWGRGHEGVMWDIVNENGEKKPKFHIVTPEKLKEVGYKTIPEYRNAESFGGQTPSLWRAEYEEKLLQDEGAPFNYKLAQVVADMEFAVYGLPAGTPLPENAERRSVLLVDIDNYLEKFIADSVINGINDAKWAKHVEIIKSLKVDEYKALCQEYVDNLKK